MKNQMWLRCEVKPGQFSGECAVSGDTFDGEGFSLFAPEESVRRTDKDSPAGWVQVTVLDKQDSLVLVRLPGQTLENGTTITVSVSELEEDTVEQEA